VAFLSVRVLDQHPFNEDPDPRFQIFADQETLDPDQNADPDPGTSKNADPGPGTQKTADPMWIRIWIRDPDFSALE